MGACLSSAGHSIHKSTCAFVISNKGELRQYPTPIFVSEVLQLEDPSSFICNSDKLYYDENLIPLNVEDELDAGQIYFILPKTMLSHRLSASDMAALAVKASTALDSSSSSSSSTNADSHKRTKNKARISPMVLLETSQINVIVEEENENTKYRQQQNNGNNGLRVSRSGSIRKIKKARLAAVRSFRLRLSTIYENEGCDELQVC
ncbi:uncharacterized protein [Rutidosis leptorrhynchoides]|uniref:uncharacterized protein n=1 Tax=Rutidosis leptorrhynchoides TaxID=125765 RepID=UPI003A9943C4